MALRRIEETTLAGAVGAAFATLLVESPPTPRVLVVDNETSTDIEVAMPLTRASYTVFRVRDGKAAIAILGREQVDIVLLGVLLPGISGLEVCRVLRRQSDVPVVFLSSDGGLPERLLAFEVGADDYIVRPADPAEVAYRLRAVLRRARPLTSRDVLAGPRGLVVDIRAHEVRVGENLVPATPREFDLLRLLLERRGEVLSWATFPHASGATRRSGRGTSWRRRSRGSARNCARPARLARSRRCEASDTSSGTASPWALCPVASDCGSRRAS